MKIQVYRRLVRPILFWMEPERAHQWALFWLLLLQRWTWLCSWLWRRRPSPGMGITVMGRRFFSPIGVAAGFDKNGIVYNALGTLGFGFVEVGSVTYKRRLGIPKPRVFRMPEAHALLNRMGLPNEGCINVLSNLISEVPQRVAVGVNIAVTPEDVDLVRVYARLAWHFASHSLYVHYLVLNLSCPNDTGLRLSHQLHQVDQILEAVQKELSVFPIRVPVLIKISPDLTDAELDHIADLVVKHGIEGVVATNTKAGRIDSFVDPKRSNDTSSRILGGLSGRPLRARSLAVIRRLYARSQGAFAIVASGGIETAEDAWAAIGAGASLVQVFTALVYQGPLIAWRLQKGLAEILRKSPYRTLEEAVGFEHKLSTCEQDSP